MLKIVKASYGYFIADESDFPQQFQLDMSIKYYRSEEAAKDHIYRVIYEVTGNEHCPDWHSMEIAADSKRQALEKFDQLESVYWAERYIEDSQEALR